MSELAFTRRSRTPRPAELGVLVLAAAISTACSSSGDGPPPEEAPNITRRIPIPNCDKPIEATPIYIEATPLRESLAGAKGEAELWSSWEFLQQNAEQELILNGIPGERSRVEVSATVGPMLTPAEVIEAATIVTNAIGGGGVQPWGEFADSVLYNFVYDQQQGTPDPSTPLGTLILRLQPMVVPQGCPTAT